MNHSPPLSIKSSNSPVSGSKVSLHIGQILMPDMPIDDMKDYKFEQKKKVPKNVTTASSPKFLKEFDDQFLKG